MGRPPKKPEDKKTNQVPLLFNTAEEKLLLENLQKYAKREGKTMNEVYLQGLSEFWAKHGVGNYQTLLPSWQPDAPRSMAQTESEVQQWAIREAGRMGGLQKRDLMQQLKDAGLADTKERIAAGQRIVRVLLDKKLQVSS